MDGSRDGATTDVQTHLDVNLIATRRRPRATWVDAAGAHTLALEGRVLLGSSSGLALCIADRAVSRIHAELEARDDGVWIRDLDSRNGTWIDATLVAHARVRPDGHFQVGSTTVTISVEAEPTEVPLWPDERFGPLVGRSEAMRELFMRLVQYASVEAPVLIQGETGTGKELVAQALHEASPRVREPLVVVDCAAIPEALLESELFGHARGAYTGAVTARAGAFETAQGGTVFLDEIGELPPAMQPKLLRALETSRVRRVGETDSRRIDVRFVAATHRDLQAMVAQGTFREDLYFRLSVLPIHVPPLRSRRDDVPVLLRHFLGAGAASLPPDLVVALTEYGWPGNVRELRSFAQRAKTVGAAAAWALTRGTGEAASIPNAPPCTPAASAALPAVAADLPFKVLREQWNDHLERGYMSALLARHGRNVTAIADEAELDTTYVRRLLRKHEL
jgi:transcriptional regulator with GAF, ATPase, and Fis domain